MTPRTPDGEIEYAVRTFPKLFSNRTQALVFMFAQPGTGYRWHRGALVDMYDVVRPLQTVAPKALLAGPLSGFVPHPSAHAPMANAPADIREDWLTALNEARAVLEPLWAAGEHLKPEANAHKPISLSDLDPETVAAVAAIWAGTAV